MNRLMALAVAATITALAVQLAVAQSPADVSLPGASATHTEGLVRVQIHCALSTGTCTGTVSVRTPAPTTQPSLAEQAYRVAAGATTWIALHAGSDETDQLDRLDSIVVRLAPGAGEGDPLERTMPLVLVGRRMLRFQLRHTQRGLLARVDVDEPDPPNGCAQRSVIRIQRRAQGRWITVITATARGSSDLGYHVSQRVPSRVGRYRVLAPERTISSRTCSEETSRTQTVRVMRHRRTVPLNGVPFGPGGIYMVGEVRPGDGFWACTRRSPILIQFRSGSRWTTVKRATAGLGPRGVGPDGQNTFNVQLPSRSGLYRVVAVQRTIHNIDVCPQAVSRSAHGG